MSTIGFPWAFAEWLFGEFQWFSFGVLLVDVLLVATAAVFLGNLSADRWRRKEDARVEALRDEDNE